MARPNRDAIDTFMSITGSSEEVAIQRLEEHNGDLNLAVDAHFNEGDRSPMQAAPVSVAENDMMDIDDPPAIVTRRSPSLFSGTTGAGLSPFSLLDPEFTNRVFGRSHLINTTSDARRRTPVVSHPREVRAIPIEVKDGNSSSARSGHGPAIVDVTDTEQAHGPEIRGTVTIEDDDTDNLSEFHSHHAGETDPTYYYDRPRPSAPVFDAAPYGGNDIEEEMLWAAIEASTKEAEFQIHHDLSTDVPRETGPDLHDDELLRAIEASKKDAELQIPHDLSTSVTRETGPNGPNLHDDELSRAVSLSLKTAEQERTLREQGMIFDSGPSASRPFNADGLGSFSDSSGRKEGGISSTLDVVEELDDQPLVRHRSRRLPSAFVSPNQISARNEGRHPWSDPEHAIPDQPRISGNTFPSDEWGGISTEEHNEALMLEAAMFGGVPEDGRYNFPYAEPRRWQAPNPPSPALAAQRSIREQQDDEYFESLQADREKEMKALEEERAAKQATLAEERRIEEEARRKLEEEQELERLLAAKEASLPLEPSSDADNVVTLVVRMPNGSRRGRRFLKSDKLQSLYDFIDVGRVVKPGTYRVVRPYPRRPFSAEESSSTLNDLGLTSKQEALYLESI